MIRVDRRGDVLVLTLDMPGEPVNKLAQPLADEMAQVMAAIDRDPTVRACVITSGKRDSFIAGADIEQFLEFRREVDAARASQLGQEMLNALAALRVPVVAAIHGACLGGGLELALACRYRVCTSHAKTVLAVPEVQLGLIPGMGGTQRLPRLIGLQAALDMILTGKNIRARKALQLGLVDEMVHPAILLDIAVARAAELADGTGRPVRRGRGAGPSGALLDTNFAGRAVVFRKARESVMAKTHGHFPAPLAAIEAVKMGFERGMAEGLREESRQFGELAMTEVSRQLIFLFFATTSLKKDVGVEPPAPAAAPAKNNWIEVKSPMVGTYYRSPAPEAPSYVEVGSHVIRGQTLCILEAMKLMNEMESEVAGTVREVCVENAEPVEYGQVLFRIEPDA